MRFIGIFGGDQIRGRIEFVPRKLLRQPRNRLRRRRVLAGTWLCATGFSSIPKIGSPVTRFNTYMYPTLPVCASTGTVCPLMRTSISVGPGGRS